MKDGPTSKSIITKTKHQPTQYKKIIDTLPVLCADKNYQGIDDVIWTGHDLVENGLHANLSRRRVYHPPCGNYDCRPNQSSSYQWLTHPPNHYGIGNTRLWRKYPEGVTIGIQTRFRNQVSRVLQVPYRQEGFNHIHIWTMRQSNEDQNYSWNKLRSEPPSIKTHQVPQPTTNHLIW